MPITRPTKSNTSDMGCSPTTSNCVTWQGPDLPCLHLCTGDTVSDVVFKLATEVCNIQAVIDLSTINLSGLATFCTTAQAPATLSLISALQYLTDKITCLAGIIPPHPAEEVLLFVDPCLGGTVGVEYVYSDVINFITNKLVDILGSHCDSTNVIDELFGLCESLQIHVTSVATSVTNIQTQLNDYIDSQTVNVSTCSQLTSPASIKDVVQEIESQVCTLANVLDNSAVPSYSKGASAISAAISTGNSYTTGAISLSEGGNLSDMTGWKPNITGLGDTLSNIWVALADVRAAVQLIQENCCKVTCNSINVDFISRIDVVAQTLTLDFSSSIIPIGFVDNGTNISITDINGIAVHITTNGTAYPYILSQSGVAPNFVQSFGVIVIPINSLSTGKLLVSFNTNFKLLADNSKCISCFSREINYVNPSCCSVTNTGSSNVTLTIKTC
jgi:hypothetical protein